MRKILERYIAKVIIQATLLTSVIFTCIMFLLSLLSEFKNMGEGDYSFTQAIVYVLMRLPNQLYQFSPMLLLLGSVIGLSILSSHREIAVMRVSGFSTRKIGRHILIASLMMVLLLGVIGEYIGPKWSSLAEIRKENAQNAGQAVITAAGVWMHVDNNFIHIDHLVGRELLEGVTRYQFDNGNHLQASYYAKSLSLDNGKWMMHDMVKTTFYQSRTKSEAATLVPWNLKMNTNLLNMGLVDPNEMSLPKLAKFATYLEQNGLSASEYWYEFWQRVLQPLAALLMIFIAIPFVLGAFRVTTLGWRILISIIVGFAFFISNAFLGQLCIVYQVPPLMAALLPLIVFGLVGVYLTQRLGE